MALQSLEFLSSFVCSCIDFHFSYNLRFYYACLLIQARKRKLGLLEDDDNSKLDEKASLKDSNDFTTVGKNRGIFIF